MHRFKSQGVSSRVFSKPQWVNPKDRVTKWNIVTGDKVNIFLLVSVALTNIFLSLQRLPLLLEKTRIPLAKSKVSIVKPTV
jgi:hypothetical protein